METNRVRVLLYRTGTRQTGARVRTHETMDGFTPFLPEYLAAHDD